MVQLKVDKEFQALIPPLQEEELSQLHASIKAEGCRDAIIVWNGTIIDGHNRYEFCYARGIPFKTLKMDFAARDDAKIWIIRNQFGRRNLSDIDRIKLATDLETIFRPKAKENLSAGGKRGAEKTNRGSAKLPKADPINTRKESAKVAGVGERTYDAGKLVLDAAAAGEIPAEDVDAIRRKEKSIHRVAKDIKDKRQKQKRQDARHTAVAESPPQFFDNVYIGDFRDHFDKVADSSLSLIFTDPPYDKDASKLFPALADFAEAKLAEGGSLLMYVGHLQLPAVFQAFEGKLRHWWTCACIHAGDKALMREYGIRAGWKPMPWFVKGTRDDKSKIVVDTVSHVESKTHHDWQQSQAEAEYWIEHLCPADGIVCDPFLGGGTTAAAAIKLRRRWIGFEIDHDQAVVAMQRCRQ